MSSSENSHQIAAAAAVEAIGVDCSGDASTTSGLSWSYEQNASVYGRGEESLLDDPQISDRALPKLPSTSARISSESVLQGLSINKLNFHRVQLQGRQKETDQLKSLWNDIWLYFSDKQQLKEKQIQDDQHYDQNDITETPSSVDTSSRKGSDSLNEANNNNKTSCKKILAIVDGLSGVGKSKLVTSVLKSSVQSRHSFFITGKFDLKNIHVPFDGIMMAVDDLCDQILRSYLQDDTLNTGAIKGNGGDAISGAVSALASKPSDTSISPLSPTSIGRKTVSGNTIFSKLIRFNEIKQLILGELSQELPFLISIFPKLLAIVGDDYDGNGGGGSVIDGSVVFGNEKEAFVDPVIDRAADGRQQHGVDNNDTGMTASDNLKANADRLKYCVRRFIQVICSYRPLVVFCDDCQWADDSSLDVLHQLLTDGSNHDALMVVCAFRTDEVFTVRDDTEEEADMEDETTSNNPMAIFLKKANHLEGALFSTHRLSIGNLSIEDLNAFLLDLLASDSTTMSQKETMDLAVVLFEKTTGNIFFVVQVLLALQEKGFISYNLGLMKWIWDAQEIKENVPVADNIVEFVKAKLQKDANARQLLPIAACIGSRFDDLSLARVIRGLRSSFDARAQTKIDNSESLESFLPLDFDVDGNLERCCREGYIQRLTTGASACRFQFVHDRVQEAAMKTAPEHLQVQLKHQVGSILARDLPEEELPSMVFTILGLVNEEMLPQSNETKRLYLKLNMLAGEKAMSYSAFKSAAIYFKNAVELLPDDSFEKQYSMTFRVYLAAAEAEFCLGNFDTMNKYCDAVLSNNLVAAVDKLRISNIVMDSLVAQNKARQSIDLAIASLAQCGCYFPRNPLRTGLAAAVGLMRTKFSRKMQDPASIANLPFSADPAHATVMKTLDKLATATFVAGASDLFPLVILKSLKWTFTYGITVYSPAAFALVALLLTNFMDDFGAGWNYARSALIMMKRLKCKDIESRAVFVIYTYIAHWTRPMQECMRPLMKAYRIGLSSGDVMSAMYNVEFYCEVAIYTGMPLPLVDKNCSTYGDQMEEFGQMNTLVAHKMVQQMVRILMKGASPDPDLKLTGDLMDQDKVLKQLDDVGDELMTSALHRYRIILACYIGAFETGSNIAIEWSDRAIKLLPGQPTNLMVRFCSALCCYAHFRASGKKKFLKEAKRQHKFIRRWSERSNAHNPNSVHREIFLSAELDAACGKTRSAYTKFESAILMAGRRGVIQDQALANERFAAYCEEKNDMEEASFRRQKAIALYTEWSGRSPKRLISDQHVRIVGSSVKVENCLSGWDDETSSNRCIGLE